MHTHTPVLEQNQTKLTAGHFGIIGLCHVAVCDTDKLHPLITNNDKVCDQQCCAKRCVSVSDKDGDNQ